MTDKRLSGQSLMNIYRNTKCRNPGLVGYAFIRATYCTLRFYEHVTNHVTFTWLPFWTRPNHSDNVRSSE